MHPLPPLWSPRPRHGSSEGTVRPEDAEAPVKIIDTSTLRASQTFDPDTTSWVYNGLDCAVTTEIYETLIGQLDNQTSQTYALERALQGPVLDMNLHGLLVDQRELHAARKRINESIAHLEAQLSTLLLEGYGRHINWRSPVQLQSFLYDYLQLPVVRKRKDDGTYGRTADRKALEKLQVYMVAQPLILHILTMRDLGKQIGFLNTSIDTDGYMRSNFNIAGTVSGRLASSYSDFGTGTNLQNVARLLRIIFTCPPGYKLANLDLEQADSRNVGANCWNKFLATHGPDFAGAYLDACESGDLHTTVARMARPDLDWGGDPSGFRAVADRVAYRDLSHRDLAKILGHGTNYYGQPFTMAGHSKLPVAMVEAFQRDYFNAFPCVREGHAWTRHELETYSHLSTIMGRRRFFWGNPADDKTLRDAISYEGQGSTADEINTGLLTLWRQRFLFPGFQLLLQVHDSILFWFREEQENEIIPWAVQTLRVPIELSGGRQFVVPTEAKTGWNWGDFNDDPKKGRINLDGLRKWKGGDDRKRLTLPSARPF